MQLLEALKSFWLILLSLGTKLSDPEFWELSAYFVENFTDKIKVNLEEGVGSHADFTLESSLDKTKNNILAIVKKLKEQNKPNIKVSEAKIKKRTGGDLKKYKSTFAPARPNTPENMEENYDMESLSHKIFREKFEETESLEKQKENFIGGEEYDPTPLEGKVPSSELQYLKTKRKVKRKSFDSIPTGDSECQDFKDISENLADKLFSKFAHIGKFLNQDEQEECESLSKLECVEDSAEDDASQKRKEKMKQFVSCYNFEDFE